MTTSGPLTGPFTGAEYMLVDRHVAPAGLIDEIAAAAMSPTEAEYMLGQLVRRLAGIEAWATKHPYSTEPAPDPLPSSRSWRELLADAPPPPSQRDTLEWWCRQQNRPVPAHGVHKLSPAEASQLVRQWHHLNAQHSPSDRYDATCEWCARGEFGVQYGQLEAQSVSSDPLALDARGRNATAVENQ